MSIQLTSSNKEGLLLPFIKISAGEAILLGASFKMPTSINLKSKHRALFGLSSDLGRRHISHIAVTKLE